VTEAFILVVRIVFGALGTPGVEATDALPVAPGGSAALVAVALAALVAAAIALARSRSLATLLVASSGATLAYALVEAAAGTREGIRAAIVLVGASVAPTIGAFYMASIASGGKVRGADRAAPVALFLAALAAPPLVSVSPGVFTAALRVGGELGAAATFSCIAIQLCCYARAIRSVIAEPAAPRSLPPGLADAAMIAFFTVLTIAVVVYPDPLVRIAARAAVWLPM
jgi:NADH:ubiquinone oxidoreductase subunit 2 (subunit N)